MTAAIETGRDRLGGPGVQVGDDDAIASRCEPLAHGGADGTRASGDEATFRSTVFTGAS